MNATAIQPKQAWQEWVSTQPTWWMMVGLPWMAAAAMIQVKSLLLTAQEYLESQEPAAHQMPIARMLLDYVSIHVNQKEIAFQILIL